MSVNPRMVTLARELAGLTQNALANAGGISQAALSKIEHGLEDASETFLAAAADECEVPVEFFAQPEIPLGEGLVDFYHRKRLTLPAKPLKKAHALANVTRLETLRLLRTLELTHVAPFPSMPSDGYESPAEVATAVRALWRIPSGPLPDLIGLVETTGVPVVCTDLGHEKLSAVSMPGIASSHVILLNSRLPASHQRFALAHELGHLTMHGSMSNDDDMEREADRFASELLMPARDIEPQLRNIRFRDLGSLKPLWCVSLAALIRRAHDLGGITDRQYRTFNMQLNQLPGGRKREPGEFDAEVPTFIPEVIDHYQRLLGYTLGEIARLMVTLEDTVRTRYLGLPTAAPLRPVARGEAVIHEFPVRRATNP